MKQLFSLRQALFVLLLTSIIISCGQEPQQNSMAQSSQLQSIDLNVAPKLVEGDYKPSTLQLPENIQLLSPVSYENLVIYYITGSSALDSKDYVTLENAMEKKMVKLYETGTVSELQIDNLSDEYIYINSGDIVRGGKQDRTIRYDVILPPKSKSTDLASFCVERGRWAQRGKESVGTFSYSTNSLSSNDLKIAAKKRKNQSEVWEKVDKQQKELEEVLANDYAIPNANIQSAASGSSLELSLENKHIDSLKAVYKSKLDIHFDKNPGVLGLAYFINGQFHSLDIYNNRKLFLDLKNKLLESAITEAISKKSEKNDLQSDHQVIERFLNDLYKPEQFEKLNEATVFASKINNQNKTVYAFSCIDNTAELWLHHNIIREL